MKTIAIIVERESGVFFHRLLAPFAWLAEQNKCKVITLNGMDSANVGLLSREKVDEIWFNRVCWPYSHQDETIAKIKRLGIKVVCDIDDHWVLPEGHYAKKHWDDAETSKHIQQALLLADVVTTTHERLKVKCIELGCKDVRIIANAINYNDPQFSNVRDYSSRPLVFGWQGSAAHKHDIKVMAEGCKDFLTKNQTGAIVLAGGLEDIFVEFAKTVAPFGNYPRKDGRLFLLPARPVTQYGKIMNDFFCCLIPIADIEFNKYKSNLKFLEASAKGLPSIVSDRHPYADDLHSSWCYPVRDVLGWYRNMHEVEKNRKEAVQVGLKARRVMREKYHFETEAEKRINL